MKTVTFQRRETNTRKTYTCVVCGENFEAGNSRAKFCSNRCKQKDKYRRDKEKREAK